MGKKIPKGVNDASDIADFLFATKSIERLAKGAGSWGDLIDVGITAASFFIPPLRLAKLPAKSLTRVIVNAEKVIRSDAAPAAVKRAVTKTMDDALSMKRQGYIPTGNEPVERVGRAGLGEPTPSYQVGQSILKRGAKESDAAYTKRVKDYEEGLPTPAAIAERGKVSKGYTRTPDEEYDPFKRDLDVEQEADDLINSKFGGYVDKKTEKYVANPKKTFEQRSRADMDQAERSERYDKTKFTQEEIEDRIEGLSKKELESPGLKRQPGESKEDYRSRLEEYVRGGDVEDLTPVPYASTVAMRKTGEYTDDEIKKAVDTFRRYVRDPAIDRDAKEVIALYAAARRMVKTVKVNSKNVPEDRRISRQDLKVIKESFIGLRKEFKEKVLKTAEGKALLKQLEKEMPSNPNTRDVLLRYEESLADDAKPGELKALIDEAMDDTPIAIGKGAMQVGKAPVKIKSKVPDDILDAMSKNGEGLLGKESPMYQEELRFAELLIERSKLNAFNASNANKLKTVKPQEVSKIKQSTARNKKILSRIDDEIAELRDGLREGFSVRLQKLADEVTKRNLAKRSEKYGPFEGPIKLPPAKPGKGGETAKLTREGKIAKAEAEMERLREEWTKLSDTDVEGREKLKQEAKKFADYIKKLKGK